MTSSVKIHTALLAVSLIAAYLVWTREPSSDSEDEISIVNLRSLDKVIYEDEDRKVEITRRQDDKGEYHWVRVEKMVVKRPPPPPPRPPASPGATPGAPAKVGTQPASKVPAKLGGKRVPTVAEAVLKMQQEAAAKAKKKKKTPPAAGAAKKAPPKKPPSPLSRDPKAQPGDPATTEKPRPKKPPAKAAPRKPPAKAAPPPKQPEPASPGGKRPAAGKPSVPAKAPSPAADKSPFPMSPTTMPTSKLPPRPAPKKVEKERKVEEFKGNKAVAELLTRLASFAAFRSLGKLNEEKLKEFELADSKKKLILVSGSDRRTFIIGGKTYGNTDNYVLDKEEGRAYVIRPRALQDLQYAEYRLLERDLLDFETAEIERATITAKAGSKSVVQHSPRDPKNAAWNKAGGEKKRNDLYHNWMGKLLRLRAMKYVTDETKPLDVEELCTIEFTHGSKKLGWLKLYRGTPPEKSLTAKKPKPEYYATSDNTRSQVQLARSLADELIRDLDSIIKD